MPWPAGGPDSRAIQNARWASICSVLLSPCFVAQHLGFLLLQCGASGRFFYINLRAVMDRTKYMCVGVGA